MIVMKLKQQWFVRKSVSSSRKTKKADECLLFLERLPFQLKMISVTHL